MSDSDHIYSVSQLNREVRTILEGSFTTIWMQGEISNFVCASSGHMYFSLKDSNCQVRCAMFKNKNYLLNFEPTNGLDVLVQANVSLYDVRGEFQIIIEHMELVGSGLLQRAFEALKQKLDQQGLFDERHKQIVPELPQTIGVITSPTGAAIRDILSTLKRRYPSGHIIIYPSVVQGTEAASQLLNMVKTAGSRNECDVLIIARGGGSFEDLAVFNDEDLARAVFSCPIPVVSGIGHEIDFTIVDFVADQRAPTPTAAAELVSSDQQHIGSVLDRQHQRLIKAIEQHIGMLKYELADLYKSLKDPTIQLQNSMQRLDSLYAHMTHTVTLTLVNKQSHLKNQMIAIGQYDPKQRLKYHRSYSDQLSQRLQQAWHHLCHDLHTQLQSTVGALDTLSPLATLQRGYAIVQRYDDQQIIQNYQQLSIGDQLSVRLARGSTECTVDAVGDEI